MRAQLAEVLQREKARRRGIEQNLADAEEWMELAHEAGGVSAYAVDLHTGRLRWSESNAALWGWTPSGEKPDVERWLNTIHPDDRAKAQAVMETGLLQVGPVSHDFRIVMPDGEVRHIEDRARVLPDAAGRPQRIVGINVNVSDLKRSEAARQPRRNPLPACGTFEHAAVGVAHVATDGRFLMVNPRLCEFLGYSEAELLEMDFQQITHPKDLEPDIALVASLLAGEVDRYQVEKRYIKASGEIAWADLSVALLRDEDGEPLNFVSVITDIGQRKQTEGRLNFMLAELAHRSRNTLAVVLSAVRRIGVYADSVDGFERAVVERILEISAAEQSLARNEIAGASIAQLIQSQLSIFLAPGDPRLMLEGPPLRLGAAATHTLGLALHELATNACKHGALSTALGRVTLAWSLIGPPDAPTGFIMSWTERGGPAVEPPTRHGFGRRVVEHIVTSSLGGEVEMHFAPEGVTWRLEAPASCLAPLSESPAASPPRRAHRG